MTPSMVAPPAMSYFIFSMPSAGLMEMPPVSKVTALPTRPMTGAPGFGIRGRVGHHHHARGFGAALGHAEQRAHLEFGDVLFVEDVDGQAGFLGHGFGFFGQNLRSQLVGRLVDEVAGEILRFGDDAAARQTLFRGGAVFVGIAGKQHRVDGLVVLFVGLVFVGFEVGGESALGDGLGGRLR